MTEPTPLTKQLRATKRHEQRIDVYDLRRTCAASPSQWEGRTGDHDAVFIRFRWGELRVTVTPLGSGFAGPVTLLYEAEIGRAVGDRLGGHLETAEMYDALAGVCTFHGACDEAP